MKVAEELIVPPPPRVDPFNAARSTLVLASIETLRGAGLLDRYKAFLAPDMRTFLLEGLVPGIWVPSAVTMAHYEACNALGLSTSEQFEIGRSVFVRVQGTLLGTALKISQSVGATPWLLMPQLARYWARALRGSAVTVTKTGPKDARITLLQLPLIRLPYFRNGYRGLAAGMCELFCRKCFIAEMRSPDPESAQSFRLQWY